MKLLHPNDINSKILLFISNMQIGIILIPTCLKAFNITYGIIFILY